MAVKLDEADTAELNAKVESTLYIAAFFYARLADLDRPGDDRKQSLCRTLRAGIFDHQFGQSYERL